LTSDITDLALPPIVCGDDPNPNLIPGTTKVATLDGARMHFPDERAAEFLPLLRQHWATHQ
jgi:hypothetical protein